MSYIRHSLMLTVLGLMAGVIAAVTLGCNRNSDTDDSTQVSINVVKEAGASANSLTKAMIDPNANPAVAVVVTVSAPDLSPPLVFSFTAQEVAEHSGLVAMNVPSGDSRTFDVQAFEFLSAATDGVFPGALWLPTSTASARTYDLNGTAILMNLDMNKAPTTSISGIIRDMRQLSLQPLDLCANPDVYLNFAYITPSLNAGTVHVVVEFDGSYTVSNIPSVAQFLIGGTDMATGAVGATTFGPGMSTNVGIDLAGATPLQIAPSAAIVTPGTAINFTAIGGAKPYTFQFFDNFSGGTITSSGQYVAGTNTGVIDTVEVIDACYGGAFISNPIAALSDPQYSVSQADVTVTASTVAGGGIAGQVVGTGVGGSPDPMLGATVSAEPAGGGTPISSITASDGSFLILGLPAGNYWVTASASGYMMEYYDSSFISAGATDLAVTVGSTTTLPNTITLTKTQCNDNMDGDWWMDAYDSSDPGCASIDDIVETTASYACDDGIDNDGDTFIDKFDPGCAMMGATSTSEQYGGLMCDNGTDDDGDGLTDMADPGCISPSDSSERDITTNLKCDDGIDNDGDTLADYPNDTECITPYYYTEYADMDECSNSVGSDIDQDGGMGSSDISCVYTGNSTAKAVFYPCDDGLDNDGDGYFDYNTTAGIGDPGCSNAADLAETAASITVVLCDNGLDDDSDGMIDMADPGCSSPTDTSETNASLPCNDGIDNDGDGNTDYPNDTGCLNPWDTSETQAGFQCDDGQDNDGDTLTDLSDSSCNGNSICNDELFGFGFDCTGGALIGP